MTRREFGVLLTLLWVLLMLGFSNAVLLGAALGYVYRGLAANAPEMS